MKIKLFLFLSFFLIFVSCGNDKSIITVYPTIIKVVPSVSYGKMPVKISFTLYFTKNNINDTVTLEFYPAGITGDKIVGNISPNQVTEVVSYNYKKAGRYIAEFYIKDKKGNIKSKNYYIVRIFPDSLPVVDSVAVNSVFGVIPFNVVVSIWAYDPDIGDKNGNGIKKVEYFFSTTDQADVIKDCSDLNLLQASYQYTKPGIYSLKVRVWGDSENSYVEKKINNIIVSDNVAKLTKNSKGNLTLSGSSQSIFINKNRYFIADDTGGIKIFDKQTDYYKPITFITTDYRVRDIYELNNYLFSAGDSGIFLYHLGNSISTISCGNYGKITNGNYYSLTVTSYNGIKYLIFSGNDEAAQLGVGIINITQLENDSPNVNSLCNSIKMRVFGFLPVTVKPLNSFLFLSGENRGLEVYNLSDVISLNAPSPVTKVSLINGTSLQSAGIDVLAPVAVSETVIFSKIQLYYGGVTDSWCRYLFNRYPDPISANISIYDENNNVVDNYIFLNGSIYIDAVDQSSGQCPDNWSISYLSGYEVAVAVKGKGLLNVVFDSSITSFVMPNLENLLSSGDSINPPPSKSYSFTDLKWVNSNFVAIGMSSYGTVFYDNSKRVYPSMIRTCDSYGETLNGGYCSSDDQFYYNSVNKLFIKDDKVFVASGNPGIDTYLFTGNDFLYSSSDSILTGNMYYDFSVTENGFFVVGEKGELLHFDVNNNDFLPDGIVFIGDKVDCSGNILDLDKLQVKAVDSYDDIVAVSLINKSEENRDRIDVYKFDNNRFVLLARLCNLTDAGPLVIKNNLIYFFSNKSLFSWEYNSLSTYNSTPLAFTDQKPDKMKLSEDERYFLVYSSENLSLFDSDTTSVPWNDVFLENYGVTGSFYSVVAKFSGNNLLIANSSLSLLYYISSNSENNWNIDLSFIDNYYISDFMIIDSTLYIIGQKGLIVMDVSAEPVFIGYYEDIKGENIFLTGNMIAVNNLGVVDFFSK